MAIPTSTTRMWVLENAGSMKIGHLRPISTQFSSKLKRSSLHSFLLRRLVVARLDSSVLVRECGFELGKMGSRARLGMSRCEWRGGVMVRAQTPGDGEQAVDVDVQVILTGNNFTNGFAQGIPGFDDSELPRLLGTLFGSLILLNHAFSLDSMTGAQLRSEAFGLLLAAIAIGLPYIGSSLKGGETEKLGSKLAGNRSIFALADMLTDAQKQELAWGSYALLRNTKMNAVILWHQGEVVCARGSWDIGEGGSKALTLLRNRLKNTPFVNTRSPLYIPSGADARGWEIVPNGAASLYVHPFIESSEPSQTQNGGLILISYLPRSCSSKDRTWFGLLAQKCLENLTT